MATNLEVLNAEVFVHSKAAGLRKHRDNWFVRVLAVADAKFLEIRRVVSEVGN